MKINIIAIGKNMPSWVIEGFKEYAKRMPCEFAVRLIEVAQEKRPKNADVAQILRREGEKMLKAIPKNSKVIVAEVSGTQWTTEQLAEKMQTWHEENRSISLLIGGPEGLAPDCLKQAESRWSLSPLTFPHPLARLIIAEQSYRAWSILAHHPYHRA